MLDEEHMNNTAGVCSKYQSCFSNSVKEAKGKTKAHSETAAGEICQMMALLRNASMKTTCGNYCPVFTGRAQNNQNKTVK